MKTYKYTDGSKIEVELVEMPPNVVHAMGECHVGDCWTAKLFHATASNGRTAQFDKWGEAKQFLSENADGSRISKANAVESSDLLDALLYVANNAQMSPNDSVRDICNEAFDICGIPLMALWSSDSNMPIRFLPSNADICRERSESVACDGYVAEDVS